MGAAADRRSVLRLLLTAAAVVPVSGHTPYRQWQVYRQKHLLIGTHKADPLSYPLGEEIAQELARRLPDSRARVTRGPDALRLASLLTTGQLDVVLLTAAEVAALAGGRAPFAAYGTTELRTLARHRTYHLIVRPDFPRRHAWRIAEALPPMLEPDGTVAAPLHPGVVLFLAGEPMPEPSPGQPVLVDHVH